MEIWFKYAVILSCMIFFAVNAGMVVKKKISSEKGNVWALLMLLGVGAGVTADFSGLGEDNPLEVIFIFLMVIILFCYMYTRDMEATDIIKRNSELTMQVVLLEDEIKRLTEKEENTDGKKEKGTVYH